MGRNDRVRRAPRNIAHRIIEEFMLAANQAVPATSSRPVSPPSFASTSRPIPAVMEFEEIAAHFAIRSASAPSP